MSESQAVGWGLVVRRVSEEFGVTDGGELDLGLDTDAAACPPAAAACPPGDDGPGFEEWVDRGWVPGDYGDPETDPDDFEAWLVGLPADVRADFLAGPWTGAGEVIPAGFTHRDRSGPAGAGFAAGGVLDTLVPGPWLAEALTAATSDGHAVLGESELIGVLCGWRRMASWAAAGEAAAVVTLARRRAAQSAESGRGRLAEHVTDEIAAALTLTGRSAQRLLELSAGLSRVPEVLTALRAGGVDWPKAGVFADELAPLDDAVLAAAIAGRYLDRAAGWTTGQLRAALRRAVLAADPDAAGRRQREARRDAQVQAFDEPSGNAGLAGRELPPAEVLAADARLTVLARWLRRAGAPGSLSQLRAAVYTALLTGRTITSLLDQLTTPGGAGADGAGPDGPGQDAGEDPDGPGQDAGAGHDGADCDGPGQDHPVPDGLSPDARDHDTAAAEDPNGTAASSAGAADAADAADVAAAADAAAAGWPAVSGTIHLTMPMPAFLGDSHDAGEVAGHGPVDAATSRQLAGMLAAHPKTQWCLTLTGPGGRAAAHACARRGPAPGQPVIAWAAGLRERLQLLEQGTCSHARQAPGYVPPNLLRHLITVRQRRCSAPGCRRPAVCCDIDHSVPYDQGGRTCECNLAPACRRHHRAKQAPGWQLTQPRPGEMTWRLPSGRVYETAGDPY